MFPNQSRKRRKVPCIHRRTQGASCDAAVAALLSVIINHLYELHFTFGYPSHVERAGRALPNLNLALHLCACLLGLRQVDGQHTVLNTSHDLGLFHIVRQYQCLLKLRVVELATQVA